MLANFDPVFRIPLFGLEDAAWAHAIFNNLHHRSHRTLQMRHFLAEQLNSTAVGSQAHALMQLESQPLATIDKKSK